jgi:prepilin-type processing-associated H-X9-DG protein
MYCPKCGKENPDDAQSCSSCNCALTGAFASAGKVNVRVSGLGIASLVFGVLSIFAFPVIAVATQSAVFGFIGFLFTTMAAIILGIISLVQIGTSAGRIVGMGFAVSGITVAGVLLFLMGIMWPALHMTRMTAFRMVCGSNLSGIGKAMLIYSNDYDDKLPRAGGKESIWAAKINDWKATDKHTAFNLEADGSGGQASISSSFYLLVKYAEVTPKSFICKEGELKATEFKLSEETHLQPNFQLLDAWDFGSNPPKHCSYSYHIPYGPFPLTTSNEPGLAVAADRNPWIPSPFVKAKKDFNKFDPNGTREQQKYGNAVTHKGEGQNVLFLDGHCYFEKRPFCAISDDNIYTFWGISAPNWDKRKGIPPQIGSQPKDRLDSLLVNDPPTELEKPKRSWWPWRR